MPSAWYILHSYSGQENKVQNNILRRVKSSMMDERVTHVLVPKERKHEFIRGKRVEVEKIIFPGYIFVEMELDEESWAVVRHTPGVIGFVNLNGQPIPMTEEEMDRVFYRIEEGKVPKIALEVGQKIVIASGPFEGLNGIVEVIYPDKDKVRLLLGIFGRDVTVEVDATQIKKV
ncbi:MAG: Transcription termination/antitermination protein NusG [candidate division WS2 bacterium]|nr:Transcription termination/antitermination protein NusG [Candidatus Lithacetigena glycinireducens]MBT9174799.1 Transcription termination/antitermination protein NusG [Candidatus Lithacetigena glycinireducens]